MRQGRVNRASLVICRSPHPAEGSRIATGSHADENNKASAPPLRYADHICETTPSPRFVNAESGVSQD